MIYHFREPVSNTVQTTLNVFSTTFTEQRGFTLWSKVYGWLLDNELQAYELTYKWYSSKQHIRMPDEILGVCVSLIGRGDPNSYKQHPSVSISQFRESADSGQILTITFYF